MWDTGYLCTRAAASVVAHNSHVALDTFTSLRHNIYFLCMRLHVPHITPTPLRHHVIPRHLHTSATTMIYPGIYPPPRLICMHVRHDSRTLLGHNAPISSLSWTSEGLLLSGSWDETAKAWDLETATCKWTLGGHEVRTSQPSRPVTDPDHNVLFTRRFSIRLGIVQPSQ